MNDDVFLGSAVRRRIFYFIIIGFGAILIFQLFRLQVLSRSVYEEKSNENSVKREVINPPRGIFYDRNMKYVVSNEPTYSIEITPVDYNENNSHIIESAIDVEPGYIKKILKKHERYSQYQPRRIIRDIDFKRLAWLEENRAKLHGVNLSTELKRSYIEGLSAAHIFGYTKEIDSDLLNRYRDAYDIGDYVGHTGLEKTYEEYIRGEKGYEYYLVDSQQKIIGRYENGKHDVKPKRGYDLVLSIDAKLQKYTEQLFIDKTGALVAIEPKSGEVLALVNAPSYDLSKFASVTSGEFWSELSKDTTKPLFNRATMTRNPPGSTFKMVAAVAALEEGIINKNFTINCRGSFQFGDRPFKCTHVHGKVNIVSAIEKSCNVFFYQLILKIGLDRWARYARAFGFDAKTGIDIGEENSGLIPDTEYYNRVYGKGKWTEGYLISLAIGQGEIITTPLQLAQYTCMLANMGTTYQPHLVKGYIDNELNTYTPMKFEKKNINISEETLKIVREGMRRVVQGNGTAAWIRSKDFEMAGKTGTAQNPHGKDHALFIAFAPFKDPQIAVAVIVENVGFGSTHAAPIARDVIKKYLSGKSQTEQVAALEKE